MKKYHVIAGLPRSGSTLLGNILNQNPRFHATPTSALSRLLVDVRNAWENYAEHNSNFDLERKANVLKGIRDSYYQNVDKEVIFDKSRVWPIESELAEFVMDDPKFIITVRDVPEVLSSFEKLYRKNAALYTIQDKKISPKANTMQGRCELWASPQGPVGSSLNALLDLNLKNKQVFLVEYKDLVKKPAIVLDDLYEFIGEDKFKHDFDNVEQTIFEDDRQHGILGLHDINSKVAPTKNNPLLILGKNLVDKYSGAEFWK